MTNKLLTKKEAADALNMSVRSLHRLILTGEINSLKVGHNRMFDPKSIDAFIKLKSKIIYK